MSSETIADISRLISNAATVYPGDDPLRMQPFCSIGPGCPCNITRLGNWSTHILTHLDAPLHFISGGLSLDQMPLHRFIGEALVIPVAGDCVMPSDIASRVDLQGKNILFKTRNSAIATEAPFDENHVFITQEAADLAIRCGVNMIGIDYLSVDRHGDTTYPVHYALLGNNVLILEGIDLSAVDPGCYRLTALPLKIAGADGSPVRAILTAQSSS